MPKFNYTFLSYYPLDTYEDVINTYEWLSHCFEYVFLDISDLKLSSSFSFTANQINYECSSIDEFKENAFGLNIKPEVLYVSAKDRTALYSEPLAYFWTRNNPEDEKIKITLSSNDKKYLISLKDILIMEPSVLITLLEKQTKSEKREASPIDSTTIHDPKVKPQRKRKESWYAQLFWKIVIPIVVTVIAAIIVWKLGLR